MLADVLQNLEPSDNACSWIVDTVILKCLNIDFSGDF